MGTDITAFVGGALPAHLTAFFDEVGSNIEDRVTVPSLSYEGKVWQISLNGEKTALMAKPNDDGDVLPLGVMRVVVLDYAKRRGRAYYEGAYDPAKPGKPLCWSDDGIAPDESLPPVGTLAEPGTPCKQAAKCDACPWSAKGSKVSDNGKAVTACSQHRMLAVVPANQLGFEPLRLKIAMTSDWDKQSPELEAQGWRAFSNYFEYLKSMGVPHTAGVVTRMKFDPGAAYPKVIFSADRPLGEAEIQQIIPVVKGQKVKDLLAGRWTPAGPDGVDKAAQAAAPAAAPAATPEPVAATPAAVPASEQLIEQAAQAAAPKRTRAKKETPAAAPADDAAAAIAAQIAALQAQLAGTATPAAAAAAPATTPATQFVVDDDDDDEGDPVLPGTPATSAAAAPATTAAPAASADIPPGVASLLDAWGDDD